MKFRLLDALLELFYPSVCKDCGTYIGDNNIILCEECIKHLPRTYHESNRNNKAESPFVGNKNFVKGAAFCFFDPNSVIYTLIHDLKYHNKPQYGIYLGSLAAKEISESRFFEGIDYLVPVPLHKIRQRKRGYNQAEMIAKGISAQTGIPIDMAHLYRTRNNETQTRKNAKEREENTKFLFSIKQPSDWKDKHILLIDDIITTGSTLRACMTRMNNIKGIRVSVFTIGASMQHA